VQENKIDELFQKVYNLRFVDIAIMARNMYVHNQCLMPVNVQEQPHAITDKVIEYYEKDGKKITIRFYDTDAQDDELDGMYTRYNYSDGTILFDIDIRSNLNRCWRRFIATKELSHTLLDRDSSSFTTNVLELSEMLVKQAPNITNHEDIHSEYLAMFFAVELLLPYNINDKILDSSKNSYQIASMLSVPEKMVDMVRSDWYQKLRIESYDETN